MNFDPKKLLKQFDKNTIKKVLELSDLSEMEYWVLHYGVVENRMVENTCAKLSISRAQYFIIQNLALVKVGCTFKRIINLD